MNKSELMAECMVTIERMWLAAPLEDRTAFRTCPEDDLIQYHHSLGRDLRNECLLWTHQDIIGCPDEFSMEIIHNFWEQLNGL